MEKATTKTIIFLMCGVLLAMITGCEPEGAGNTKKERLYAAENLRLQEADRNEKQLTAKCEKQLAEQKSVLERCEEEKKGLEKFAAEGLGDFPDEVMTDMLDEIGQLRIENEKLKEEVEQLKKGS